MALATYVRERPGAETFAAAHARNSVRDGGSVHRGDDPGGCHGKRTIALAAIGRAVIVIVVAVMVVVTVNMCYAVGMLMCVRVIAHVEFLGATRC